MKIAFGLILAMLVGVGCRFFGASRLAEKLHITDRYLVSKPSTAVSAQHP